jgi:hypothetical protein
MKRQEYNTDGTPIFDDDTPTDNVFPAGFGRGFDPSQYRPEMFAPPSEMNLIPESEWDARIEEQERTQSSLEHLYLRAGWENLDQDGHGYCWSYSVGTCDMVARTRDNMPHRRLNPHAVAAIIKGGRDQGGWCGLSWELYSTVGCPEEGDGPGQWPLHSRNLRHDTPEMRAAAAANRVTEDWVNVAVKAYDRNLSFRQIATQLLLNNPVSVDYEEMGHSMAGVRLVKAPGNSGYLIRCLNSWKGWGRRGLGDFRWVPMGAVAVRQVRAA